MTLCPDKVEKHLNLCVDLLFKSFEPLAENTGLYSVL